MMAEVAQLYNTLPTLGEANEKFVEREATFKLLAALLAEYRNVFGLCLVHAHCKLTEGEIMLAKRNVSQPEKLANAEIYYPERWLSDGKPYEFTVRRTKAPPHALIDKFQHVTKDVGLHEVLGLYHIDGGKHSPVIIEWTEGRKNLTRELTEEDKSAEPVQTAWDFARGDPVTMACTIYCDTRTTRSGDQNVHKGMDSYMSNRSIMS